MKVLFIAWDGPQVNYLQGLFLPIFQALGHHGYSFRVLQFTWGDGVAANAAACEEAGIPYEAIKVWRRPVGLGGMLTAILGARRVRKVVDSENIDVLMPRSTLPALAVLRATRHKSVPVVFDADGLPLDERVDFGGRPASSLSHRFLRDIESQAVRRASVVLTRTRSACDVLRARAGAGVEAGKFHVVSNGRDEETFSTGSVNDRRTLRRRLRVPEDALVLVYVGSIGKQYCLDRMLRFFELVTRERANTHFVLITGAPELAEAEVKACSADRASIQILSLPSGDVPAYLAAADLGLAFRKPAFSMQAVAPIKLGEYLLCGVPVLASANVGDTDSIKDSGAGLVIDESSDADLEMAAHWVTTAVVSNRLQFRERCRQVGLAHFSLEASVESYRCALDALSA